ncbi:hypothetical protein CERSUDRAFT_100837 [Gelatoporia subvermispora B]|uniref:Thioesterase domain-containing protein n=1 Tax=Ceriporiopsis subvermispora (strain B) TaxID=914234 RepID=M2QYE0_CERS8|nr:hypothetical protein CERSUDRAFT_100837 [Gelatoporia subvermispora B]
MVIHAPGAVSKTFNFHKDLNDMDLRPVDHELTTLVIDAMGQDQHQILNADNAFLIESLRSKRSPESPYLIAGYSLSGIIIICIASWQSKLRIETRKNLDAMYNFEAPHCDEPTTLIMPKDCSWYRTRHASDIHISVADCNGGDYHLSKLDLKVAPGRHDTMFTPVHVKILAGMLEEIVAMLPAGEASIPSSAIAPAKQNGSANRMAARNLMFVPVIDVTK